MKPRGPYKTDAERLIHLSVRVKPDVYARLAAAVPARQRSAFIREAILARLTAQAAE